MSCTSDQQPYAAQASTTSRPTIRLSPQAKGGLLLLAAIMIWGANWPVMKLGLSHVSPLWFSATRFASGALCLFALQLMTGTLRLPTLADMPLIVSVGLLQMLAFTALGALAMTHIEAGRAILAYTTPLWVTPVAIIVLREKLSARQLMGTALGVVGVLVLFNPLTLDWGDGVLVKANLMLLLALFCWAMCILHLRHSRAKATAYQLAPWQMLLATLPLAGLARWIEGPFSGDGSNTLWTVLLFVGPLATAFCFCAVNAASMWLSSTSMSSAMLAVPVVGLLMSVFFLGESLTPALVIGILSIVGGILVVTVSASNKSVTGDGNPAK
ncbi:DMT family transporter [Pseudomonas sp.]|uniref:DMT family transporter n=1 Tax=Pseudomonas sp. TaxID=306 RepID=UPI00261D1DB4|nr:DMT family transporter [Pseudomonas sp.]